MDVNEAIRTRKSIRAFTADPLGRGEIEEILATAVWAPSGGNAQNWRFIVLQGERRNALEKVLVGLMEKDRDLPPIEAVTPEEVEQTVDPIQRRRKANKLQMSTILKEQRVEYADFFFRGGVTFFGAPAVVLVTMEHSKGLDPYLSLGALVQNLTLSAHSLGLGTCWICMVLRYEEMIKKFLGLREHQRVLSAIALGRPVPDSPVNLFRSTRDDIANTVTWIGFD